MNRETRASLIILAAVMIQIMILRAGAAATLIALSASTTAAITLGGYRFRRLLRTLRGLLVILTAVLLTRLLAEFSLATVQEWALYTARLLSAVMIAVTALGMEGTVGIERGLRYLMRPVPLFIRRPILDLMSSTLFVLPVVRRRFTESSTAARIRLTAPGIKTSTRLVYTVRSVLVSVAAIPRDRAEAMVVRGLLRDYGRPRNSRRDARDTRRDRKGVAG